MAAEIRLNGLPRKLVQDGVLDEETTIKALQAALKQKVSFIRYLVENKILPADKLAMEASLEFGLPVVDLDAIDPESMPKDIVDDKLIQKHHAMPLYKRGNRLYLGISDPTNHAGLDEIRFHTGLATSAVVVEEDKLAVTIEKAIQLHDTSMSDMLDTDLENLDLTTVEDDDMNASEGDSEVDEAPVVRFVNKVLLDAINAGASDIHFEPYEKFYRIRFRQDGLLIEMASPPLNLSNRIASRLKVMSKMNIAERRVPQDQIRSRPFRRPGTERVEARPRWRRGGPLATRPTATRSSWVFPAPLIPNSDP